MLIKLLDILKEEVSEQFRDLYRPYYKDKETGKYKKNIGWDEEKNYYRKEGDYATSNSEKYSRIYDKPDITKYPNIEFSNRSKNDNINPDLLRDVNTAAEKSGVKIQITYAITDHDDGVNTRHDEGEAVDLSVLNGIGNSGGNNTKFLEYGDLVVNELKKLGYKPGESGCGKSYLWRVKDHFNHIHVSYKPCN